MTERDRILPTIAEVLSLPPVAAGEPHVLAGQGQLHRAVRWVHVAPPSGGQRLLLGGELLLATGVGWPEDRAGLRAYVEEFATAGAAGLVLELGNRYDAAPDDLLLACTELDLPLIVLRREVRFVSITEAVHSQIINSQTGALRERDRVHGLFAELSRRGCSTSFLLDSAARLLGRPVVLEDLNHRALAWSSFDREPSTFLTDWLVASRRAAEYADPCPPPYEHTSLWAEAGWLRTPVEADGQRWGTVVALNCMEPPQAAEVVLENLALALSLGRLSGRGAHEWSNLGQGHLLSTMLDGSYVSLSDLQATFEASGLRVVDRDLVAVARRGVRGRMVEHLDQVRHRSAGLDIDVLCSPWAEEPSTTALFLLSFRRGRAISDEVLLALLEGRAGDSAGAASVITVGSVVSSFGDLMASAEEALTLVQSTPSQAGEHIVVHQSRAGALNMLLSRKRSDPAVQAFVERALGPLLIHDAQHQGDLLDVARACARHPTNRKQAAAACHLSRSVFYQRLQKIEELLGADLNDGGTLAMLHVAIVAYGQRSTALQRAPESAER